MGSLGDRDPSRVTHMTMGADAYDVDAADNMKHMVMGMTAVAMVFASVIAILILSGAVSQLSGVLCASVSVAPELALLMTGA